MSLHTLTEDGEWHAEPLAEDATVTGRCWEVRAICECGYVGPWRGGDTLTSFARARIDYREHVETALGAGAYYVAHAACRNCGSEHDQGVLIGTHVSSARCERCGTTMLQPSNDAWDESRERARRWSW